MTVEATVFKGSETGIVQGKSVLATPTGTQVLVRITHSGICGTDEHYKHADMVLGHEGVGIVEQIGEGVLDLAVGDVVGWGYIHKSCGRCEQCLKGQDNYCRAGVEMYGLNNFHQGSFGSHAVWDESYLFKVPAGLAPEHAAPLMCGGATVFQVIEDFNIRPTDRVGVIALGGLGHMAVQFLAKMGAEVVVFSSTDAKREEALNLGAKEFYATKGVERFEGVKSLDHLLVTTSSIPDWAPFLALMKPKGAIYPPYCRLVQPRLPYDVYPHGRTDHPRVCSRRPRYSQAHA
ncbi:NAD(P)-dependent alcohol dehydrogenase protein [Mycena indigotica]|uniref:NAD(P)-dependent alcohol dehydrogenase protein n=1 Tax=Mycena indigotica TaxID=2126181 RepID=A0A8H6WGF5_9AGAR|nr:NAD(P)-dependent alcohol dehydrogenase protein [Mycena indigotica]KAF7315796.1 NAD(P)-dependent alcohol dehydrogenase protein [Mycena indigotica]